MHMKDLGWLLAHGRCLINMGSGRLLQHRVSPFSIRFKLGHGGPPLAASDTSKVPELGEPREGDHLVQGFMDRIQEGLIFA